MTRTPVSVILQLPWSLIYTGKKCSTRFEFSAAAYHGQPRLTQPQIFKNIFYDRAPIRTEQDDGRSQEWRTMTRGAGFSPAMMENDMSEVKRP
jgi:hypothetical protein